MRAEGIHVQLKLKRPFGISRETRSVQETFIVALSQDGHTGYGEATANRYYGVTVKKLLQGFEELKAFLENYTLENPEDFWTQIKRKTGNFRFLMAALDEAAWDLYGKLKRQPLYRLWQTDITNNPPTSYTIGIDEIEIMKEKIREMPWPVYKIKLGTDHDEEIIRSLREVTDKPFRVDANAAWTPEKTLRLAGIFKDLNVEFIEQPLPAEAWKDMQKIKNKSPLPLIADESCRTETGLANCLDAFHGINVKLTKAGGLTPGKYMLKQAIKKKKLTMIGCMTESSVGISAAAQLLPLSRFADLDGPLLIANDPAQGVEIENGEIIYSDLPGTGVKFFVSEF